MPKPTFRNLPPEKRDRIVEAALQEFAVHPYGAASINTIVDQAGIAKGSFYQYFDGKFDLFRYLVVEVAGEAKFRAIARHPLPPEADVFSILEHMIATSLRFALDNPRLVAVARRLWQESSDPELRAFHDQMHAMGVENMLRLLEVGRRAGHLRADVDPLLAADFVYAILERGLDLAFQRLTGVSYLAWFSEPPERGPISDETIRDLVHQLMDLLRNGMGASHRAAPVDWDGEVRGLFDTARENLGKALQADGRVR